MNNPNSPDVSGPFGIINTSVCLVVFMYLKVIYCKYINANMYHIAAAVFEKFLFLRIGLEDTVTNVETSITKRFI